MTSPPSSYSLNFSSLNFYQCSRKCAAYRKLEIIHSYLGRYKSKKRSSRPFAPLKINAQKQSGNLELLLHVTGIDLSHC
jgi:hypothetical protein